MEGYAIMLSCIIAFDSKRDNTRDPGRFDVARRGFYHKFGSHQNLQFW